MAVAGSDRSATDTPRGKGTKKRSADRPKESWMYRTGPHGMAEGRKARLDEAGRPADGTGIAPEHGYF
jgi:hypothetical protein